MTDDPRLTAFAGGTIIAHWASEQPDADAVVSEHGSRSYAELEARVNQLVRALRRRGVGADDPIALLCPNRPEYVEVYGAAQRAGLRLTPLNWHLTGGEAGYILDDCEAVAFVADARFETAATEALAAAPGATVRFAVGGPVAGFEDYEAALAAESSEPVDDPLLGTTMLYTSGTTGRPKGVHREPEAARALAANQGQLALAYRAGRHRHLCTGPLYHAAPLAFSLVAPLAGGAAVVLMDGWDAEETLRLIEAERITHTHMVPTMFHRLLSLPDETRSRHDLSSLRFVIHGAAPCPVPVKQAIIEWWGPIVHEYYAATEGAGSLVTADQWLERPGTVGKPADEDHVRILSEDGAPLGPGEVGTVYLRSPETGRFSYFKDDDKTERAYAGDYYTLGDHGYLDEEGWLFLTDRSAHLIISGGVNIYPAEVEAVLLTHAAVGDAGVIGVPDEDMGERVLAVVEPAEGVVPSPELAAELVEWCRARLAHFKCPREVDFADELPRQDNGKLYKEALRRRYRSQPPP